MPTPKVTTASLDSLVPDPLNVRRRDERAQGALAKSVEGFGLGRSVVVDAGGVVRAGNGTLEAARAAGVREVIVVETDGTQLVAVRRSDWSEPQAIGYSVADNQTGDLSYFDPDALKAVMGRLVTEALDGPGAALVEACGFDEMLLHSILKGGPPPKAAEIWKDMPEFAQEDLTAKHRVLVSFKSKEDKLRFAEVVGQTVTEKTRSLWWPEVPDESTADLVFVDAE